MLSWYRFRQIGMNAVNNGHLTVGCFISVISTTSSWRELLHFWGRYSETSHLWAPQHRRPMIVSSIPGVGGISGSDSIVLPGSVFALLSYHLHFGSYMLKATSAQTPASAALICQETWSCTGILSVSQASLGFRLVHTFQWSGRKTNLVVAFLSACWREAVWL